MSDFWGMPPEAYHRLKNLLIFGLGIVAGIIITLYLIRVRVLDFVKEDLGGKLKALQFYPENSRDPITIINSKSQLYIPFLIYLSLIKNRRKNHKIIWESKILAVFYAALLVALGIVLAIAVHFILVIQM